MTVALRTRIRCEMAWRAALGMTLRLHAPWPKGTARERSLTMKKKGKKDEAKGPKKGK